MPSPAGPILPARAKRPGSEPRSFTGDLSDRAFGLNVLSSRRCHLPAMRHAIRISDWRRRTMQYWRCSVSKSKYLVTPRSFGQQEHRLLSLTRQQVGRVELSKSKHRRRYPTPVTHGKNVSLVRKQQLKRACDAHPSRSDRKLAQIALDDIAGFTSALDNQGTVRVIRAKAGI